MAAMGGSPNIIHALFELAPDLWHQRNQMGRLPNELLSNGMVRAQYEEDALMFAMMRDMQKMSC